MSDREEDVIHEEPYVPGAECTCATAPSCGYHGVSVLGSGTIAEAMILKPDAPRTAAEVAMKRADEMALEAPIDHRDPQQVAVAENPYVARKEAVLKEVISSKYSLRRSALMRPERGRMVVARVEWADQIGSLFLPQETKEMHTAGNMEIVVLACGDNRIDPASGREVKMQYSPRETIGKHAVIRSLSGMEFIWYDENGKQFICYLIGQSEIWMWLEPPPGYESEMQNSPDLQAALRYIESGLAQKALPPAEDCGFGCAEGLIETRCPTHGSGGETR